jgi:apolipoprotein D and lipocalin family protein
MTFQSTVDHIDIPKFMGLWYVWAGRTTFLERNAYSAIEKYTWNAEHDRIDIDFTFHKGDFNGKLKRIPQKAWIKDKSSNAHWKIQPFWPLKLDYLVLALDPNYDWTVIGVPNGAYLWIMGRVPQVGDEQLKEIVKKTNSLRYPTQNVFRVPQKP